MGIHNSLAFPDEVEFGKKMQRQPLDQVSALTPTTLLLSVVDVVRDVHFPVVQSNA